MKQSRFNCINLLKIFLSAILILDFMPSASFAEDDTAVDTQNTDAVVRAELTKQLADFGTGTVVRDESGTGYTVFDMGDNKRTLVATSEQVRFFDEKNELVDYEPELVEMTEDKSILGKNLSGYAYVNKTGDSKQYMPINISEDTPILMEKENVSISFSPTNVNTKRGELIDNYVITAEEQVEKVSNGAKYILCFK